MVTKTQSRTIIKIIEIIEKLEKKQFTVYEVYKNSDMHYDSIKNGLKHLEVNEYLKFDVITQRYSKVEI